MPGTAFTLVVMTRNISRHCSMSPGGETAPIENNSGKVTRLLWSTEALCACNKGGSLRHLYLVGNQLWRLTSVLCRSSLLWSKSFLVCYLTHSFHFFFFNSPMLVQVTENLLLLWESLPWPCKSKQSSGGRFPTAGLSIIFLRVTSSIKVWRLYLKCHLLSLSQ